MLYKLWPRQITKESQYISQEIKEMPLTTNFSDEHYRVGVTQDGKTTLTMMSSDGLSMTLSMNQDACEQLIRLLRATYTLPEEME